MQDRQFYDEAPRQLRMKEEMREPPQLLIVDDEDSSRAPLARMLTAAGYRCLEADNALAGLDLVRKEAPSVLLIDFKMPEIDGAEMLKRLRADPEPEIAQVPANMITGHEDSEVLCLKAGADDFVKKPINLEVLRARIETQLRLRAMRLQLQKQTEQAESWKRDFERDLDAARLTQQSLIPHQPPTIPGWDIAASYRPVIQVGGDIYG
jgi:DNA-binding response OmpR family regulator